MMIWVLWVLFLALVPGTLAQVSEGTGYKVGVIVGTFLAAIIFFGICGFLGYYLCVRKRLPNYTGGGGFSGFVSGPPRKAEKNAYRMGADPQPVARDYQRYEAQTGPPPPEYRIENNRHVGVSEFEREPGGRNEAHDQAVLTTSSYASGPIVTNQYQQEGKNYTSSYQQHAYRTSTQASKMTSAAYTGSSV